jgi:hypothetical protein
MIKNPRENNKGKEKDMSVGKAGGVQSVYSGMSH